MAKPSSIVSWAQSGSAVDPGAGIKATGWLAAQQPPAEFMNWIFKFLGEWTEYLDGMESNEVLTWALSQIFNKAITVGNSFAASEAEAISPRIIAEPVSSAVADYTLLLKSKDARLWAEGVGSDSALVLTVNATRTTAGADTWTKITSSQPAMALFVSRAGISLAYMPAAQNTAWAGAFVEGEGTTSGWGRVLFLGSAQATETDAQQDVGVHNTLVNGTSERKLLWTIKPTGSNRAVRLYYMRTGGPNGGGGFEIVLGAAWGNSANLWTRDISNTVYKLSFSTSELVVQFKESAAGAFDDNSWTLAPFDLIFPSAVTGATDHTQGILNNGHLKVTNTKSDDENDANPPPQTDQANKISVRNVHKVTAYILTSGGGAIDAPSGYNLEAGTDVSMSGDVITVNFGTPFDDANYEATATVEINTTAAGYWCNIFNKGVDALSIRVWKTTTGGVTSVVDLDTEALGVNLHITGKQTT